MNLIFRNSLEKRLEDNGVRKAQVSIYENDGAWQVLWTEPQDSGEATQECWFEGAAWDGMLQTFRESLRLKLELGFTPLLRGYLENERQLLRVFGGTNMHRGRATHMLHYYSELHANPEVFQSLRQWRKEQSAKESRAAYIVATNQVLQMISAYLPRTIIELQQLPGFGENRSRLYGEAILAITANYDRTTEFPLHWVAEALDEAQFEDWLAAQKQRRDDQDMQKQLHQRKLLEAISEGGNLSSLQKQMSIRRSEIVQSVEELDKAGYDVDRLIEMELEAIAPEEMSRVSELFKQLGDRYLKPVLNKLYTEEELKGKDVNRIYEWMRLYRLKYRKQVV
jgi:hypothetical protein